ncbi:sensor histidine kinase [Roseomonas sp. 18066]|uniref:sensor histidine kinase n=1 Tax=Roseomonas sp. 18066 TaxID=2681412 RepID=UPI00135B2509|nr:PAS domain-containing hybrid sensor histidine kinase/response regulator [Roseomonas sp. 18066]
MTEASRLQSALAESEARLRRVQRIGQVGGFEIDLSSGANLRSAEYMAVQGLDAVASTESHAHWLSRLHPEDRARAERRFLQAVSDDSGACDYAQEYRIVTPDGAVRWISARAEIERDADGRALRMVGAHHDITALRESQAELERLNQALEQRVRDEVAKREAAQARAAHAERMRALGQLASGIAHDMNNLLQTVQSGAAIIARAPDQPEQVAAVAEALSQAAERGTAVTSRLLSFARQAELRAEPVPPATLLEQTAEILRHSLGRRYACQVVPCPGLPSLLADRRQLETALLNLAINARDAMPDGGVIFLSAAAETVADGAPHPAGLAAGDYLRLGVRDDGMGMDAETLARVTEPFFTTKPAEQGTGLGLSMAKGFAEQSGGGLALDSAPGEGTLVSLWLPAAR